MRQQLAGLVLALALVPLASCDLENVGGGGGGGGPVVFNQGFVFVRPDDRNLYVADRSDFTNVARLTSSGSCRHPSLSRDGRRVVYVESVGAETALMVISTSGAGAASRVLAQTSSQRNFRNPVFSPDGTRIAFAYDEGSASVIGVVNGDGSGFSKVAGTSSLSYGSPSFYPDGSSVLVASGSASSGYTQLERLNLSTGSPQNVSTEIGPATRISNRAVLSPDATKVAFDGQLSSGEVRVFVMTVSSRQVTQLTDYADADTNDGFPSWVGSDRVGFSSSAGGNDSAYALGASSSMTSGGLQIPGAIEPWYGPN